MPRSYDAFRIFCINRWEVVFFILPLAIIGEERAQFEEKSEFRLANFLLNQFGPARPGGAAATDSESVEAMAGARGRGLYDAERVKMSRRLEAPRFPPVISLSWRLGNGAEPRPPHSGLAGSLQSDWQSDTVTVASPSRPLSCQCQWSR